MGKAGWLKRLLSKKHFFVNFAGTFLAALGLPSALLTILGKHFSFAMTSALVLLALGIAFIANKKLLTSIHLPADDILAEDVEKIEKVRVRCPCNQGLENEAKELAQGCYSSDENCITPDQFEKLRLINTAILACLTDATGDFLGYFDVIPLKDDFARLFIRGKVTEKQIAPEDVYECDEIASCKYVFISGLAVCDAESHFGRRNASILVWALLQYLDHFYGSSNPLVFAIASTKEGEDLLQKFRLQIGSWATSRIDHFNLYSLNLNHKEVTKRLRCLPDWSRLCSLDWRPRDSKLKKPEKISLPKRKLHTLQPSISTVRKP